MPALAQTSLQFGPQGCFQLQPHERRLLVNGKPATLGTRAFDLLVELASRPGELRSKHELIEAVWPGVVVEEGNLTTQISSLRKLLGGEIIVTIPGRGYRFAARIDHTGASSAAASTAATGAETEPLGSGPVDALKLQTNLPATLPHLVGRKDDLAALNELIHQHRLVSIIGAGGMGKTTVALHLTAARQTAYRHGVCWVELAAITDAAALPSAIAAAIGVHIGSGDPLAGLCGALMPLTMLVALDNAEQVIDGVARLVQAVLDKAPGVRFIVTTQTPLKLASELVYRIGPLTVPQGPLPAAQALGFSAVALFAERARQADARFALTDANAPAVIALCRQLDGLALAIELAAARAPMLSVQRLATSMGDRLKVLTTSRKRAAPARQQTLRAALEWSHGFLDAREQAVFRRIAVFAGSAALGMIQQVVADPDGTGDLDAWTVLDALALLVERSLVVAIAPDDEAEPRYRLLETPRMFAREKLQQAGEETALRERHAHAVAAAFDAAHAQMDSGAVRIHAWKHDTAADLDNGREALAWALAADDPPRAVQIATTLGQALPSVAFRERVALVDAIEPMIERVDGPELIGRACALIYVVLSPRYPQRALTLLRQLSGRMPPPAPAEGDDARWIRHRVQAMLAAAGARIGDSAAADAALTEARALFYPAWPAVRTLAMVDAEAFAAAARDDLATALHWTRRQVAAEVACGYTDGAGPVNLIDAELAAGATAEAVKSGEAAVAELASGRDEWSLAFARMNLSAALLALDRSREAAPHLRAGWTQAPLFDMQPFFADYLALLAALEGRFESAARLAGFSDVANASGVGREPNEAAAIARAVQLARTALGADEFDRLHQEGKRLPESEVAAHAFAAGAAA